MSRLFFRAWFFLGQSRCFINVMFFCLFCCCFPFFVPGGISWILNASPFFLRKKKVGHFKKTPLPQFRIPGISVAASRNNLVLYHAPWTPVHIRRGISKFASVICSIFAVIAYATMWFHVPFFWVGFRFHPRFCCFWGIFGRTNMTFMIDQKLDRGSDGTLW